MGQIGNLLVFKKSFDLAMDIWLVSKTFPKVESYSLTDQIRRSSRSVCANLAEAWSRRKYLAHFLSKLTDSDSENAETKVWVDFSFACNYIHSEKHKQWTATCEEIGRLLGDILRSPKKYL